MIPISIEEQDGLRLKTINFLAILEVNLGMSDFNKLKNYLYSIYYQGKQSVQEVVICAAVKAPDGYIIRGHRHSDCVRTMAGIPRYQGSGAHASDDEGFITSTGRYVGRKEGYQIQVAAGIPSFLEGGPHADGAYLHEELYSEDLY